MMVKITLLILTIVFKYIKADITGFIVGGNFTEIKEFPYSVYLNIGSDGKVSACGASILNQALLLTAAHCLYKCQRKQCIITAYTGSETKYDGVLSNIISFKMHDSYDDDSLTNDIALLKLEKELKLGETAKRVIVMKKPPESKTAKVAGWGRVDISKGSSSIVLKQTMQQVLDRKTCNIIVLDVPIGAICGRELGFPERGDSGSALVIKGTIQIGIVSYKNRYRSNQTVVYTDVAHQYSWIMDNARHLSCEAGDSNGIERKGKVETDERELKEEENIITLDTNPYGIYF